MPYKWQNSPIVLTMAAAANRWLDKSKLFELLLETVLGECPALLRVSTAVAVVILSGGKDTLLVVVVVVLVVVVVVGAVIE